MSTTKKDRDKLARRLADHQVTLAAARDELGRAEAAWAQAVMRDAPLDTVTARRARCQAKVDQLSEVAARLELLVSAADADLASQQAVADHVAAVETHQRAVAEPAKVALPDVEAAITAVLAVADRLREQVEAVRRAHEAEQAAAVRVVETAVATGVEPPQYTAVDPLDAVAAGLSGDRLALRVWSAASQYTRRDTAERLGEAAGQRAYQLVRTAGAALTTAWL